MPNANRPGIPTEATKIPPALNSNLGKQPHDNMAPFMPAPISNASDGGSHTGPAEIGGYLNPEETGTGRE